MPSRASAPAAMTPAAASKRATGIDGAMAAALEGEDGKPDSNTFFALELQSKREKKSEFARCQEHYTPTTP